VAVYDESLVLVDLRGMNATAFEKDSRVVVEIIPSDNTAK
jgi:hypothetical protein